MDEKTPHMHLCFIPLTEDGRLSAKDIMGNKKKPVSYTHLDVYKRQPVVLEQALKKAGTQLLEPYLSFTLFAPQEYLSRAYNAVSYTHLDVYKRQQ